MLGVRLGRGPRTDGREREREREDLVYFVLLPRAFELLPLPSFVLVQDSELSRLCAIDSVFVWPILGQIQ